MGEDKLIMQDLNRFMLLKIPLASGEDEARRMQSETIRAIGWTNTVALVRADGG